MKRSILASVLLISLCASADAATVHHFGLHERHLRPSRGVIVPNHFAVPGWTNEETQKWLYNGSAASGLY